MEATLPREARAFRREPAQREERWDEITLVPEADPIPLDLIEPLVGFFVDVAVVGARIRRTFRDEKSVELACRVLMHGEPLMVEGSRGPTPVDLPCYFRLPASGEVPLRSKFYQTWTMANGGLKPLRRDRMALSVFKGRLFQGRIYLVKTGAEKDPDTRKPRHLPRELWRPIISELRP